MALTKKKKLINERIETGNVYSFPEAVDLLRELKSKKYDETVEIAVNLGIDAKKSDQLLRGALTLPSGLGKEVRVAVFAQGQAADDAKQAGADEVGMEDLAEKIRGGDVNFGVVIASPDSMRVVGSLGQILGTRGIMPNPKTGTVTPQVAEAVKNAKMGQIRYRTDKNGIIHCAIGKISFDNNSLYANAKALVDELKKNKPATSKGIYLKKVSLTTTAGPGLIVDIASIDN